MVVRDHDGDYDLNIENGKMEKNENENYPARRWMGKPILYHVQRRKSKAPLPLHSTSRITSSFKIVRFCALSSCDYKMSFLKGACPDICMGNIA